MDAAKARSLAEQLIPSKNGVSHERASDLGLTASQIKAIDQHPEDGILTTDELCAALIADKIKIDPQNHRKLQVVTNVSLGISDPDKPGPRPDLHQGYSTLAMRNPQTQPLIGSNPGTYTPPMGMSLEQLSQAVGTPEQVTQLLEPFGSDIYDTERAEKGTGPNGTQSPEYTLAQRKGICRDSHFLGAYVLQQNGYNARQTGYKSEGILHAILTYEGKNGEGFGLIEYGTLYTPQQIAQILGRPALSHEEAVQAVRPEAKLINRYSQPEANKEGYIESLYYTMGHLLYQETLRLKHQNNMEWSRTGGVEIEAALGKHWGIKLQADTGSSPDPTARNSFSSAVGYQAGNIDNWLRLSLGFQYRPEEGHHSIGPNQWERHPAMLVGGHAEGQVTPFKHKLGADHTLSTTLGGNFTGALAFSQGEGTNAANGKRDRDWKLDDGLMDGMSQVTLRLGQRLDGRLSEHWSYRTEAFISPDVKAMAMGYAAGGKDTFSNSGVNGSLHYNLGNFSAYLGGQYLATQVNNLEATGASTGLSYRRGRLSFGSSVSVLESPEGVRLRTTESMQVHLYKMLHLQGYANQEQIYNKNYGWFANTQGNNIGVGIGSQF